MSTTYRTGAAAIRYARKEIANQSRNWRQLCLAFTRTCFNVGPRDASAKIGWQRAKLKHPTTRAASIPVGVPVWWEIGVYDHVAISTGNGKCVSTDILRSGKPDEVDIDLITRRWNATLLGWSEDINGVRVYTAPAASSSPVTLADLKYGKRNSASVRRLQKALNAHKMPGGNNLPITGNYLDQTDAEVRLCQKLHGYGNDAKGRSFVGPRQAKHLGLTAK